jgi:cytidyltransferase-like protein
MKIVVVSGGFDPIHSGHISYLNDAKKYGDKLIVALNSDAWLIKKKENHFMPFTERKIIIENIASVDQVISFQDDDQGSCINGLKKIKDLYPNDEIIFCNGGDRNKKNIPEMTLEGINFIFGVGGNDKKNSSSWILKDYKYSSEDRIWGKFFNLFSDLGETNIKLKELIVYPGKGLSFQRHFHRSEFWFVSKGSCLVNYSENDPESYEEIELKREDFMHIKKESWHQIINPYKTPCHIIEIQYGDKTIEDDIERLHFYSDQ